MNVNISLNKFIKNHRNKKNQIIFHKSSDADEKVIENLIDNFLIT